MDGLELPARRLAQRTAGGPRQSAGVFWGFFGGALALLLLALFTRTTGIHGDENGYLDWAVHARLGDSRASGKPPLFYLVNYAGLHTVGALLGPLRPLAPYLVYVVLCSVSLAWLIRRLHLPPRRSVALWSLLLCSPLFVLNATQVMAEAPVLALLTILFASVVRPADARGARWAEAASTIVAILFKESAIPAVAALAVACLFQNRRRGGRLVLWIVAAVCLAWGVRTLLHVPAQEYGGVGGWSAWAGRAALLPSYLWLWVFLVGPVVIVAMMLGRPRPVGEGTRRPALLAGDERRLDTFLLACSLGSLIFTLGVCLTSNLAFARYAYPTIWVGGLATATWVARWSRARLLPIVVASVLLPTLNMWVPRSRPFGLWPAFVTHEAIHSGLTVMFGIPVHGWWLRASLSPEALCVLVSERAETRHVWAVRQYLAWATPRARIFDETSMAAFEACEGRKAVVKRTHRVTADACACPASEPFRVEACVIQHMASSYDRAGDVLNVYCLP